MEPLVSIICNTYNHEKYIRDTLEGFLMQKTDFPFEILVHDDSSTDKTADVIREYEAKYPDLIKPIYQTENQLSQKIRVSIVYQYPRIRGKYTAFCEGDDYWTDPTKLQRQVEALEKHPEADICACAANKTRAGEPCGMIAPEGQDCVIPVERVIKGGGDFVATCTLMVRSAVVRDIPRFRDSYPFDYTTQIHGALRGGMVYLSEPVGTYRIFGEGSWTANYYSNINLRKETYARIRNMLKILDEDTEGKYSDVITRVIKENEFFALNSEYKFKEMLAPKYKEIYKSQPFKNRVKLRIRCLFPGLIKKRREQKAKAMK